MRELRIQHYDLQLPTALPQEPVPTERAKHEQLAGQGILANYRPQPLGETAFGGSSWDTNPTGEKGCCRQAFPV